MEIECKNCQIKHQISCEELDWDAVESREKGMGSETNHEAEYEITCDCGYNLSVTFNCWEYPTGVIETTNITPNNTNTNIIDSEDCSPKLINDIQEEID